MPARFTIKFLPAAGLILALSGCASSVMPGEQIELTRSAVNRAVSADATQYAPAEMRAAQDKLNAMERALGEKNAAQVKTLAEQAEADARLAERKAAARKTKAQLDTARQGIEVLKQELLEAPQATATPR
ncbi:DUF4398 domain-containing protein [Pseudomonas wayambapalatensis]|uniref:DUF4398 domain-containing protein n=1 Tax=Pseudomonas wayambapalatensis TaxID=485895 RepID=UPI003CF19FFB